MPDFHVVSELCAIRRPARGDRRPGQWAGARYTRADSAGRHRLRQDLYHGQGHRARPAPDAGAGAQQDARSPALLASSASFSRITPWNTSSPTTTTTSPRPTSPQRTPTSRRTPPSTTRSSACATARRPALLRAAGRDRRVLRLLHLRPGRPRWTMPTW